LLSLVILSMFLASSGLSCTYLRNKKAILRSQGNVAGKMINNVEVHMGLLTALTFVFSVLDFISDAVYAFDNPHYVPIVQGGVIAVFVGETLVSLWSLSAAVRQMQKDFGSPNVYMYVWQRLEESCYYLRCILWPICMFFYYLLIFWVSLFLALTKLMAIKQVQYWWIGLMVVNYKMNVEEAKLDKLESKIQSEIELQREKSPVPKRSESTSLQQQQDTFWLWRLYYRVDGWAPQSIKRLKISAELYNSFFVSELICQSLPQLMLNIVNSQLSHSFSVVGYISAFFSAAMIVYNVAKIVYSVGFRNQDFKNFLL